VYTADERLQWDDGAELDEACICWWVGLGAGDVHDWGFWWHNYDCF